MLLGFPKITLYSVNPFIHPPVCFVLLFQMLPHLCDFDGQRSVMIPLCRLSWFWIVAGNSCSPPQDTNPLIGAIFCPNGQKQRNFFTYIIRGFSDVGLHFFFFSEGCSCWTSASVFPTFPGFFKAASDLSLKYYVLILQFDFNCSIYESNNTSAYQTKQHLFKTA